MDVYLIAQPRLNWGQIGHWLRELGAKEWYRDWVDTGPSAGDGLAQLAGRRCYMSFGTDLNPNVTRIREDQGEYVRNIINSTHGSVLEHAMYTFAIEGASRVLTHELVRHRAGTAVSQESGRYVRLTENIDFEHPDVIHEHPELKAESERLLRELGQFQARAAAVLGLDDPGVPFKIKKEATSAMRRYAPEGRSTGLVWSANIRTLRHVIESRTAAGAEAEIREWGTAIGNIMVKTAPLAFSDYNIDEEGQWIPSTRKV